MGKEGMHMVTSSDNPLGSLRNAIICLAIKDYNKVLKQLENHPENETALSDKRKLDNFFTSEWFMALTNVSGVDIMNRIATRYVE